MSEEQILYSIIYRFGYLPPVHVWASPFSVPSVPSVVNPSRK